MTNKEKLKTLVYHFGGTQEAFAELLGVPKETVRSWIARNTIPPKAKDKILANCEGVSEAWLMSGMPGYVPFYEDVKAACGQASMGDADETDITMIRGNKTDADAIITASGDSMSPTIEDGDFIGIRELRALDYPNSKDIYLVVMEDGDRYIKRFKTFDETSRSVTLVSDNEDYQDFTVPKNQVRRIYKVVSIGKKI